MLQILTELKLSRKESIMQEDLIFFHGLFTIFAIGFITTI